MEVKIVGNLEGFEILNRYDESDIDLLTPLNKVVEFNPKTDYIESYTYDAVGNPLASNLDYKRYKSDVSSYLNEDGTYRILEIDPVNDLITEGYSTGEFVTQYNFFRLLSDETSLDFFIKEISGDRTELRIASQLLSNDQIESVYNKLISSLENPLSSEFLLNLGNNEQHLLVNQILNKDNNYEILVKLYKPLPINVALKRKVSLIEELISSYKFNLNLDKLVIPDPAPMLKGANFDIEIKAHSQTSTNYQNFTSLVTNAPSTGSYQLLLSGLNNDPGININVDYSSFDNFIRFSSAAKRVENLRYKFEQIIDAQSIISASGSNPNAISIVDKARTTIESLISSFDGFEKYSYFESGSGSWPKVNSSKPYQLVNYNNTIVTNWYNNISDEGELFDNKNPDLLKNHIPEYLRVDDENTQYFEFTDMVGQFFDSIWIKLKSITDLYKNENALNEGISKDLVYLQLKSLGINLYESNLTGSLFDQMIGANTGSGSISNIPSKDILDEKYKRIYNNLPYLIQTKGTVEGLRALITCFGIPHSILDVTEYGGDDKLTLPNLGSNQISSDKIRVEANPTEGSVLTPFISIQKKTYYKANDINLLDISFSLTKKINEEILITYPNLNIDDLIGDPSDEYKTSYKALDSIRNAYFQINGRTYKYKEFVEILKYIDDSLFKTIKDFVPGRSNVITGAVISPNILEKTKLKRNKPKLELQNVTDAKIKGPKISHQITKFYNSLKGNKVPYYDGNIEGSRVAVAKYYNTLGNKYKNANGANQSRIDFNHSDFDVLQNNASGSLYSSNRRKLENGILSRVELQDSYNSLSTHQLSRYEGVKLISKTINNYNSGDKSYGKTAAVDNHVTKIGLFNEVSSNLFLGSNRSDVVIKYLVDINGDLTELNKNNYNWFEVQNTFVQDKNLTVSLFDVKKYSNQKTTEGIKRIYNSGYSYEPILYYSLKIKTLNFQIPDFLPSAKVLANFIYQSGNITGPSPLYPLSTDKVVTNIFDIDDESAPINNYRTGSSATTNYLNFPKYVAPSDSSYDVDLSLNLLVSESVPNSNGFVTYNMNIYSNLTSYPTAQLPIASQAKTFTILNSGEYNSASNKVWLTRTDATVQGANGGFDIVRNDEEFRNGNGPRRWEQVITIGALNGATGGETLVVRSRSTGRSIYISIDDYILSAPTPKERTQRFTNKIVNTLNSDLNSIMPGTGGGDNRLRSIEIKDVNNDYMVLFFSVYVPSGDFGSQGLDLFPYTLYQNIVPVNQIVLSTPIYDSTKTQILVPTGTTMFEYNFREINPLTSTVGPLVKMYSTATNITLKNKSNPGYGPFGNIKAISSGTNFDRYEYYNFATNGSTKFYTVPDNALGAMVSDGKDWRFKLSLKNTFLTSGSTLTFVLEEKSVYSGFGYELQLNNAATSSLSVNGDPNIRTIANTITNLIDPNLSIRNDSGSTRLIFNSDLSKIYTAYSGSAYFNPGVSTPDEVEIYQRYGDINYPFLLVPGDVLVVKDNSNYVYEYEIKKVEIVSGRLNVVLTSVMDQLLFDNLISVSPNKKYFELLFLTKVKDETNAILTFKKKAGKTSWGFIIPSNLHPDVIKQIDVITKEVKQKLLSEQSIIDKISGGDF